MERSSEFVTIEQLAEIHKGKISVEVIRKWIKQGRLSYYKIPGKKILIDPEKFQKYIERREQL